MLDRLGAAWYVFGAQAVLLWGRPRFTADIDITVRMQPERPQALTDALEGAGFFRLRVEGTNHFVATTRVLPFLHEASGWLLDVVMAGPGLEEVFLARAVRVDLGGLSVPVISPEDLIVTKILGGRAKDLEDVHGVLLERLDGLDVDAIRVTLRLLEDALGQSDLLPALERAIGRVGK